MKKPTLLATTTGEPYQPVRIVYRIPARAFVLQRLRHLRCVGEDAETGRLVFWLIDEAHTLKLGGKSPGPEVTAAGRQVILGTFRFPASTQMTLELRSIPRAVEIARFLRPHLGPQVVPVRMRVVNRWFEAREADLNNLDALDSWLDREVTVIDPEVTAQQMDAVVAAEHTQEAKRHALQRWRDERRYLDVPLTEDFPLCPEEETEQLRDLALTLTFRLLRASRQWAGEKVTLQQVIEEAVSKIAK